MQQLFAAFGIDWHLLLAQAVNFAIVLVALSYFLYTPVMRMLEKRRRMVAQGVEDARLAAEKLAGADVEASARVHKADTEADQIMRAAQAAAGNERSTILKDAEARALQIAQDAEQRAIERAEQLRRDSEKDIARVALLAAGKILQEQA